MNLCGHFFTVFVYSNQVLHHLTLDELIKSFEHQQKVIIFNGIFAHTLWTGDEEFTMTECYLNIIIDKNYWI